MLETCSGGAQRGIYNERKIIVLFNSPNAYVELEKRIRDAAVSGCQKLDERFPEGKPSGAACAEIAAKNALRKIHASEIAAQRAASD